MDQKKRYRKKKKTDNDHKVDLMDQKNVFSDHFFSEEALSEETLSKNPEKTEEDVIRKKVIRKIVSSDTKASLRRMDPKVLIYAFKHRPRVSWSQRHG